jgi:hypothetical protein
MGLEDSKHPFLQKLKQQLLVFFHIKQQGAFYLNDPLIALWITYNSASYFLPYILCSAGVCNKISAT